MKIELGKTEVSDFSCNSGVDIMRAYSKKAELIDTVNRYNSYDDLISNRSTQDFTLSDKQREKIKRREEKKLKLEQIRLQNMQINQNDINHQYIKLHQMLNH